MGCHKLLDSLVLQSFPESCFPSRARARSLSSIPLPHFLGEYQALNPGYGQSDILYIMNRKVKRAMIVAPGRRIRSDLVSTCGCKIDLYTFQAFLYL